MVPNLSLLMALGALPEEVRRRIKELGATEYVTQACSVDFAAENGRVVESKRPVARQTSELSGTRDRLELSFQSVVEQAKEAVVITTAQLDLPGPEILYVNRAFTLMTGYPMDEVIGKTPRILQGAKTERSVLDKLRQQLLRGESFEGETYNYRKDGTAFILQWEIAPIRNEAGEITHFVSVQRDVTERRREQQNRMELKRVTAERDATEKARKEIEQLNGELEERVRNRTAELFAINKQLEAFGYSVSHDLRAPLRHIKAASESLQETVLPKLDEEENALLDMITKSADKMSKLIDDILTFSKAFQGKTAVETFHIGTVVNDAIADLTVDVGTRRVVWKVGELPVVRGDPAMLRQVFVNLLSNALKYTRPRAVAQIDVGFQSNERDYVFFIRDNGVGFDKSVADKLFCIFERLHCDAQFEGTGVGLAIVRRIVERHGGRVWADSQMNQGATFCFSLPK
jgi:PAS domain S-box-containing protein